MRRTFTAFFAAALLVGLSGPLAAAPCKDAKGKFIACAKPAPKPARCKNAKGAFAKCGTPGARPM